MESDLIEVQDDSSEGSTSPGGGHTLPLQPGLGRIFIVTNASVRSGHRPSCTFEGDLFEVQEGPDGGRHRLHGLHGLHAWVDEPDVCRGPPVPCDANGRHHSPDAVAALRASKPQVFSKPPCPHFVQVIACTPTGVIQPNSTQLISTQPQTHQSQAPARLSVHLPSSRPTEGAYLAASVRSAEG